MYLMFFDINDQYLVNIWSISVFADSPIVVPSFLLHVLCSSIASVCTSCPSIHPSIHPSHHRAIHPIIHPFMPRFNAPALVVAWTKPTSRMHIYVYTYTYIYSIRCIRGHNLSSSTVWPSPVTQPFHVCIWICIWICMHASMRAYAYARIRIHPSIHPCTTM